MKILLSLMVVESLAFVLYWFSVARKAPPKRSEASGDNLGLPVGLGIGFITNFFDTLGIGSFATTTSLYKFLRGVRDELIPGTLNVGHAIPTVVEALIFVAVIQVDFRTLVLMIAASVLGAWLGAGVVSHWSRRKIQVGLGLCLIGAAALILIRQLQDVWHMHIIPGGGETLGLSGIYLGIGVIGIFALGALMTLGIGLYAPCMILVSLLGMSEKTAFPIMMGACAFLMPVGSVRFIRSGRYDLKAAAALAIGGIPGVLLAAYWVKSLSLTAIRWLVVVVVLYTAVMLLRSAAKEARAAKNGVAVADPAAD
jgi:uncharacterized membrane protein YfcA